MAQLTDQEVQTLRAILARLDAPETTTTGNRTENAFTVTDSQGNAAETRETGTGSGSLEDGAALYQSRRGGK